VRTLLLLFGESPEDQGRNKSNNYRNINIETNSKDEIGFIYAKCFKEKSTSTVPSDIERENLTSEKARRELNENDS
jgi:hypothetical protein